MKFLSRILAICLLRFYGYEGINLLFRVLPSSMIVFVLRLYGAKIGDRVRIQAPFVIHNADQVSPIFQNLEIGNQCYIGRNCLFDLQDSIIIEDQVTISHGVILNTHTNAGHSCLAKRVLPVSQGPIHIENNSYIGLRTIILQGIKIGAQSVIGANSLVNKNIPSGVMAFGQPCTIQRKLDV